jgi:hypothetical protein
LKLVKLNKHTKKSIDYSIKTNSNNKTVSTASDQSNQPPPSMIIYEDGVDMIHPMPPPPPHLLSTAAADRFMKRDYIDYGFGLGKSNVRLNEGRHSTAYTFIFHMF